MQIINDIDKYLCEEGLIHISPSIAFEAQFIALNGMSYLDASEIGEDCMGNFDGAYRVTGDSSFIEAKEAMNVYNALRNFAEESANTFSYLEPTHDVGLQERTIKTIGLGELCAYCEENNIGVQLI